MFQRAVAESKACTSQLSSSREVRCRHQRVLNGFAIGDMGGGRLIKREVPEAGKRGGRAMRGVVGIRRNDDERASRIRSTKASLQWRQ